MIKKLYQGNRHEAIEDGRPRRRAAGMIVMVAALTALGGAVFGQARARVTVSPAVEPRQPVVVVVDGKVVAAESVEWKRGEQAMVWLRDLENLGWGTASAGEEGSVLFKSGNGITLTFTKGQGIAKVNSLAVHLTVDVYLKDGRLMVPLSFVAKSLGYEYDVATKVIATVTTKPVKAPVLNPNSLTGKVTYAGKGAAGISVRAVDREFKDVKGSMTRTGDDGSYKITGLPDGEFMAYVYVEDNPAYFNRASESAVLKDGQTVQLKTIAIGRIITPVSPKPDAKVTPVSGKISLEWAACPLSTSYELVIRKQESYDEVYRVVTKTASTQVPASSLKAGGKYEAVVTALDASGDYLGGTVGTGGKPWSFTVAAAASGK